MTRPLRVGDRVHYPGDPNDLGVVVEVRRYSAAVLWDKGQPRSDFEPHRRGPRAWTPYWRQSRLVVADIDAVLPDGRLDTGDDADGSVARTGVRWSVVRVRRDLAKARKTWGRV